MAAILAEENKETAEGGRKYCSENSILSSPKSLFLPDQINMVTDLVIKK